MSSYLYILHSAGLDKYYIGATDDLEGRLRRHLTNHDGFTGKSKDWVLVYKEAFLTMSEARARERQLKSWKSAKRIREFNAFNPAHFNSFLERTLNRVCLESQTA